MDQKQEQDDTQRQWFMVITNARAFGPFPSCDEAAYWAWQHGAKFADTAIVEFVPANMETNGAPDSP